MGKKTYYKTYTKDLTSLIVSETGGDLRKLISSCMQAAEEEYDPDYHTEEKAVEDAEELYEAGQGRWEPTKKKCSRSFLSHHPSTLKWSMTHMPTSMDIHWSRPWKRN